MVAATAAAVVWLLLLLYDCCCYCCMATAVVRRLLLLLYGCCCCTTAGTAAVKLKLLTIMLDWFYTCWYTAVFSCTSFFITYCRYTAAAAVGAGQLLLWLL